MDVEWVLGALSSIGVSDADLDLGARVFVLPYPRSGFLSSTTCGSDIFLSPGVVEIPICSIAMIATHELGHVFQRSHAPEEGNESWSAYLEIRDEERERQVRAKSREAYEAGVGAMREIEGQAKLGKVMEVSGLQHTVSAMLDNLFQDPAAVLGLTAIKGHYD